MVFGGLAGKSVLEDTYVFHKEDQEYRITYAVGEEDMLRRYIECLDDFDDRDLELFDLWRERKTA